eukprot:SM008943S23878  [mRNA]  locus=s8943:216:608:+ [translate_table: standard]
MAVGGEASEECQLLWEALECAVCHPAVGTSPGPPAVCASLCDRAAAACADAFYSADPNSQVLAPCGPRDTICARGGQWAATGDAFCRLAGFAVQPDPP